MTKLDAGWFEGSVLRTVVSPRYKAYVSALAANPLLLALGISENFLWSFMSISTIVLEVALALALHVHLSPSATETTVIITATKHKHKRNLSALFWSGVQWFAFVVGPCFHVMLHVSGISIGLFSFYMSAFYILVMPPVIEDILTSVTAAVVHHIDTLLILLVRPFSGRALSIGASVALIAVGSQLLITLVPLERHIMIPVGATVAVTALVSLFFTNTHTTEDGSKDSNNSHRSKTNATYFGLIHLLCCVLVLLQCYSTQASFGVLREYHISYAHDHARNNQMDKCIERYQLALLWDTQFADGWADLSLFLEMKGDQENAHQHNQHVLTTLEKNNLKALTGEARYYDNRHNSEMVCQMTKRVDEVANKVTSEVCNNAACHQRTKYAREYALPMAKQLAEKHDCT